MPNIFQFPPPPKPSSSSSSFKPQSQQNPPDQAVNHPRPYQPTGQALQRSSSSIMSPSPSHDSPGSSSSVLSDPPATTQTWHTAAANHNQKSETGSSSRGSNVNVNGSASTRRTYSRNRRSVGNGNSETDSEDEGEGQGDLGEMDMDEETPTRPSGSGKGMRKSASTSRGISASSSRRSLINGDRHEERSFVDEEEEDEEDEEEWSQSEDEREGQKRITLDTILHVEVRLIRPSPSRNPKPLMQTLLEPILHNLVENLGDNISPGHIVDIQKVGHPGVIASVDRILLSESEPHREIIDFSRTKIVLHLYTPWNIEPESFTAVTEDDDEADAVPAATVRDLPSTALEGMWENLVYSTDLKPRLLRYINSTMAFSDARVDFNKVSWNRLSRADQIRLLLLHGPPGTGKTSLCRGLAQKLLIRMNESYDSGKLVEINSHSLFSKWFSESGKLVQKLFSAVTEMVDDPRCLVVVMIDEVESLTAARSAAVNGTEPSDALRVVNALLTQLDKLKTRPNVLITTTSNIPDTIDSAFIDRADEKFFVDYPPPEAVYWILQGCLEELRERGMLLWCTIPRAEMGKKCARFAELRPARSPNHKRVGDGEKKERVKGKEREDWVGMKLWLLSEKCHRANLAGRFLRRLPLLAHSRYLSAKPSFQDVVPLAVRNNDNEEEEEEIDLDAPDTQIGIRQGAKKIRRGKARGRGKGRSIETWLEAFERAVDEEIRDRERVGKKVSTKMGDNGSSSSSLP